MCSGLLELEHSNKEYYIQVLGMKASDCGGYLVVLRKYQSAVASVLTNGT